MRLDDPQPGAGRSSITRPLAVMAALLVLYFVVAGRSRLLGDPDTLWHIAVGRTILESGLVTQDSFSFSRYGEAVDCQPMARRVPACRFRFSRRARRRAGFDHHDSDRDVPGPRPSLVGAGCRPNPDCNLRGARSRRQRVHPQRPAPHRVDRLRSGLTFALLRDVEDGLRSAGTVGMVSFRCSSCGATCTAACWAEWARLAWLPPDGPSNGPPPEVRLARACLAPISRSASSILQPPASSTHSLVARCRRGLALRCRVRSGPVGNAVWNWFAPGMAGHHEHVAA